MNNDVFRRAQSLYRDKDFQSALAQFTECLQDQVCPPAQGEIGYLYHQIGNCLVKLGNPAEAIQAYTQATADCMYDASGAVNSNMGAAYASMRDYENAVRCYEVAVSDAKYESAYKAYQGMGSALMKLGRSAEAGVAFRSAALDEGNPDPTKALVNLGVCFMALNRPADAVASYESALQFGMAPAAKNRLYANLGQAYVACGQMQDAVSAFEASLADKTYFLSDSASVDYQRAIGAVAQGTADKTQALPVVADMSGLDVQAGDSPYFDDPYAAQATTAMAPQDPYGNPYGGGYPAAPYGQGPTEAEQHFFNSTDEELEKWSKGATKKKGHGCLITIIVVIVLLLGALGGAAFLYTQGFGYPSQETVIKQMFADPSSAKGKVFAKNVSDSAAASMVDQLVKDETITVDGMNKGMSESTAYVTAQTEQGGDVTYCVTLVRDMIGWKVSNVEIYFASQN